MPGQSNSQESEPATGPAAAELVARARALPPLLREHAAKALLGVEERITPLV